MCLLRTTYSSNNRDTEAWMPGIKTSERNAEEVRNQNGDNMEWKASS
jgi:hypothetical protein